MIRTGAHMMSLAVALAGLPVAASAPEVSLRPQDRGDRPILIRYTTGGSPMAPAIVTVRPLVRPSDRAGHPTAVAAPTYGTDTREGARPRVTQAAVVRTTQVVVERGAGLSRSLRPTQRPDAVVQAGLFKRKRKLKGAVCGDPDIQGEVVGRVPGKLTGCGVDNAVRVTSISGVALSQSSVMNCETAAAVKTWLERSVKPTFRRRGPVVSVRVAAHYSCRTRNNQPNAKISEHGKGKAIDISGFTMADGELITVLKGWRDSSTHGLLSQVHRQACGTFGTVLGPKADRFHQDHFHLDTARHRGGSYCR